MVCPKILVIDDSRTMRVQLRTALVTAGFEVTLASGGAEGLKLVRELSPDLVILDVVMPKVDGYRVCHEMKLMGPPWDQTPIVFLTSLETQAIDLLGDKMGAYLRKPVCPSKLLETVGRFIEPAPCEPVGHESAD